MNIDVRYKYDKTFESTIKLRDYWTMTFLKGDYHLRPITENGYKRIVKNSIYFTNLNPNIPPDRKNTKEFSKTID